MKPREVFVPSVVFVSTDLMFSSQLLGAAGRLGLKLHIAANAADAAIKLSSDCRLVIVDLAVASQELPAVIAATRAAAPAAKVVAYGAHVDEPLLAGAVAAGADLVLSRGQFHKQYAALMQDVCLPAGS